MPVARINDIDVNYKLEGDGAETIVLINGLAGDLETWVFQAGDFLAAGYRVLRFDNRGIGASSKPAGPYSSRMLADDAKALVDSLGITDFHLMGVSMGGVIAQEYALAYGPDLRSATFACTYAAPGPFCSRMFTDPATASGFLGTFGILGLIIMYLVANVALVVEWVKFRRRGIHKNVWLWVVTPVIGAIVLAIPVWGDLRPGQPSPFNALPWLTIGLIAVGVIYALVLAAVRPQVLERAPALLEGDESLATDPLLTGG